MACDIFKVGRTWHYRFQVNNKRVQRSTRLRNKAAAGAIAEKAYADALERANGGQPVPTLRALAHEWQLTRHPVISTAHARSVDAFVRLHMYGLGDLAVNDITTARVESARNEHLLTHNAASANHWLRVLKLIVNWAVKRDIMSKLPWRVSMLKLQKRPRAILPVDVAAAWFSAIDAAGRRQPGIGVAVRLMLFLGLRESEAISARWEWIDWQRATYTPGKTKGREAEPLPMPALLVEYLKAMAAPEGLIAAKRAGDAFPPGFSRRAMRSANGVCATKGITPHRLRGTIATLMSENGVPIQTIQKFLRHKSPLTTMAYLEKNMATAARAQNAIAEKVGNMWRGSGEQRESAPTGDCIA